MITIKKKFNSKNFCWDLECIVNDLFLKYVKDMFDNKLRVEGIVFLRDVYEKLGIAITRESCLFGWTCEIGDTNATIDFNHSKIGKSNEFELVFNCYPVVDCLENEEEVE